MESCPYCGTQLLNASRKCPSCGASLLSQDLLPQTLLHNGKYRIEKVLGQGGFGITYKATQTQLGMTVVLKEYFPTGARRQDNQVIVPTEAKAAEQEFLEEGRILARLSHPGIVRVLDFFEEWNTSYIVMDFVDGVPLSKRGVMPETEVLEVARQVGEALLVVHSSNLLHQDLKPDNLMQTPQGRIVLIDFGAARTFQANKTGNYDLMVTPGYAPLEQYGSQVRRGPYTDIYALSATLYHLLSGQVPPPAVDRAHGTAVPALTTVSERVKKALEQGLALKVTDRPQTIAEFLQLLGVGTAAAAAGGKSNYTASQAAAASAVISAAAQPKPAPVGILPQIDQLIQQIIQAQQQLVHHSGQRCPGCGGDHFREVFAQETNSCPLCLQPALHSVLNAGAAVCPSCEQGSMEMVRPKADKICPLCVKGTLNTPVIGRGLRCPACTKADLVNRMADRRLCACCRTGHVQDRQESQAYCPNCNGGRLEIREIPTFLGFGREERGSCNRCDAEWKIQGEDWKLLKAKGKMVHRVGNALTLAAWSDLSDRSRSGWACDECQAEWDLQADGRYTLKLHPIKHALLGKTFTITEWAKLAHRLSPQRGSHYCPDCAAEFDLDNQNMRFIDSPAGLLTERVGQILPLDQWQRIASGQTSAEVNLVCSSCRSQWQEQQDEVTLLSHGSGPPHIPLKARFKLSTLSLITQGKSTGKTGAVCRQCKAEWDEDGIDKLRMVRGRYLGESHSLAGWMGRNLKRTNPKAQVCCYACQAEWQHHPDQSWELLEVGKTRRRSKGARLKVDDWRRLAAGKQSPGRGYHCDDCQFELTARQDGLWVQSYPQVGEALAWDQWQKRTVNDPQTLIKQAQQLLLQAVTTGQWHVAADQQRFKGALRIGEEVLFAVPCFSAKKDEGKLRPNDEGELWITTQRLIFIEKGKARRGSEIILREVSQFVVRNNVLFVQRPDKLLAFFLRTPIVSYGISQYAVEVELSANEIVVLLQYLQQKRS